MNVDIYRDVHEIVLQKDLKGTETKKEIDECNSKRQHYNIYTHYLQVKKKNSVDRLNKEIERGYVKIELNR